MYIFLVALSKREGHLLCFSTQYGWWLFGLVAICRAVENTESEFLLSVPTLLPCTKNRDIYL